MREIKRTISIQRLPKHFDPVHQKELYRELETHINVDRPSVVLDCFQLAHLDRHAIHLLLCCLEEAMKRNGDVRLACLRPELRSVLKSAGLDSIFQIFDNIADAVESFRAPRISFAPVVLSSPNTEFSASHKDSAQVNAA